MSTYELEAWLADHRERDSIGGRLMIDRSRIAIYAALRTERGRRGTLVTEGLDRIATRLPASRNDL